MITLKNIHVVSGDFLIQNVCMEIQEGQCASLMGMSGSGKTTIMEAICGLRSVVSGEIWMGDRDVTYASLADRNVGLVPQDNVLFPTMKVREQISYGPKVKKWSTVKIKTRVETVAEELQVTHLLDRDIRSLSGGEAKRVAIARAIAPKPQMLCLDESFTGLDDETHKEVMRVVKNMINREKMTTLFITHYQREAEFLADVCFSIEKGVVRKL